jgi:hypothetical protein
MVDSIESTYEAMLEKGATPERPPQMVAQMPDHQLWIGFVRDPDSNLVGIMEEKRYSALGFPARLQSVLRSKNAAEGGSDDRGRFLQNGNLIAGNLKAGSSPFRPPRQDSLGLACRPSQEIVKRL